jgi:hypothetical protein
MQPNRPALFRADTSNSEVTVLCGRLYLRFGRSLGDLAEIMPERRRRDDLPLVHRYDPVEPGRRPELREKKPEKITI